MIRILFFVILAGWLTWFYWPEHVVKRTPGIIAAGEPKQENVITPKVWKFNGYDITKLARFKLRARVLAHTTYYIDRESDLAPIDLVLGWDEMSDSTVLDKLTFKQGGRWYSYFYKDQPPLPVQLINNKSANMHIIPGDANVKRWVRKLNVGDIVTLEGFLVRAAGEDGWVWTSSLSRNDTGSGACELIWVDSIDVE